MTSRRPNGRSIDAINSAQSDILLTLERSGLDPSTVLIVGGAALTLLGLRTANDVDLLCSVERFNGLRVQGQTPGGLPLQRKPTTGKRNWLTTTYEGLTDRPPLDIDIGDFAVPYHTGSQTQDEVFTEWVNARSPSFEGWHHLNPVALRNELAKRGFNRQAKRDLKLLSKL